MTNIKNCISSLRISGALKEKLEELTVDENEAFYFIFYSESNLLTLPTITIVGYGDVFQELMTQDWVIKSIEFYGVIVNLLNVYDLFEYQRNSQKIYRHLNCQLDQLVFQANEDHDGNLEIHFNERKEKNYFKKTKKWFKTRERNHLNTLNHYIANIENNENNYAIIVNGLQQLLKEIISDFQTIFFPPFFVQKLSHTEILTFVLNYCKSLEVYWPKTNIVRDVYFEDTTPPAVHFHYILGFDLLQQKNEYEATLLIEIVRALIRAFSITLFNHYVEEYIERVKQLEIYTIKEEAKASVESWEDSLETKVREALNVIYNPKSVFLLSKKYFNISLSELKHEKGLHFFIIVLTNKMTYQYIKELSNMLRKETNGRVKVTVLLQKKSNWTRHIPLFPTFYKTYFQREKLFEGHMLYIDYDKIVLPIIDNKSQYNQECLRLLENIDISLKQNFEKQFCETQAMHYHFVLQQSLILLIYNKLDFIPNIIGLKYLWDLIQWCYPTVYKDLEDISVVKRVLFDNDSFVKSYPKQNDYISNCTIEDIKELDTFCGMIYTLTKEELKNSNSIIDVTVE
ncbi:hypothetical protein [Myroides sp.]|uniref:hypothetical protein n=1 Tax=Myroides sp. TaxID=1874736 RepID=UPI003F30F357